MNPTCDTPVLRPFPVDTYPREIADAEGRDPWSDATPGCIFDGSMHGFEETELRTVRLALAWGMPACALLPPSEFDDTARELFGMHDQWWEFTSGGYLRLTDAAHDENLYDTLAMAFGNALDWLNGYTVCGRILGPGATLADCPDCADERTRCAPEYAADHLYVYLDNSLYLVSQDDAERWLP